MNPKLKAADARLSAALGQLDALEKERVRFTDQLAESEQAETRLRRERADLDVLVSAANRTAAARSLLDQTIADLEPARAEVAAAEADSTREHLFADLSVASATGETIVRELSRELGALERVLAPAIPRLNDLQDKLEANNRAWGDAISRLEPPMRHDAVSIAITERGGGPADAVRSEAPGLPAPHVLLKAQTAANPNAWSFFVRIMKARTDARIAELERKRFRNHFKDQRDREQLV